MDKTRKTFHIFYAFFFNFSFFFCFGSLNFFFFLQKLHYRLAREIHTSNVALPWFRRLSRLLK